MLRSIRQLFGIRLGAKDGDIGHLKDMYFNDANWVVRYFVADTGSWISTRLVLIAPHAFGGFDEDGKVLRVELTQRQIENSPLLDGSSPVSREFEAEYYKYYGWPVYWQGGGLWGMSESPVVLPPPWAPPPDAEATREDLAGAHLLGARATMAYRVRALDGDIGHVSDLVVDDRNWAIARLVVETGSMLSGKPIMLRLDRITRIEHGEAAVFVNLTMHDVLMSPSYCAAAPDVS